MVGLGMDSWASIVEEATYGSTPGSGESYHRFITEGLTSDIPVNVSKSLSGPSVQDTFQGPETDGGPLSVELLYEGFLLYLKHALGSYAGQADTPAAGANTHTFALLDALPIGLSIEIYKAAIPSGKVFLYEGGKIDSMNFIFNSGESMEAEIGLIAQSETPNTSASGVPSFPTYLPILWRYNTTMTIVGETSVPVKSGKILLNNNLTKDRFLMHQTIREPVRNLRRSVTGEVVVEFADLALYDKYRAGTTGAGSIVFTSDVAITGSTYYTLTFTFPKLQLTPKATPVISGPGPVEVPFSFLARHDGTDPELEIVIISGESVLS